MSQTIDHAKLQYVASIRQNDLFQASGVERAEFPPSESDLLLMQPMLVDPNAFASLDDDREMKRLLCDLDHAREAGTIPEEVDQAVVGASDRVFACLRETSESSPLRDQLCDKLYPERLVNHLLASARYVSGIFLPAAIRVGRYDLAVQAVKELVLLLTAERFRHTPGGGAEGWTNPDPEGHTEENVRHVLLYPVLDRLALAFADLEHRMKASHA